MSEAAARRRASSATAAAGNRPGNSRAGKPLYTIRVPFGG